MSVDCDASLILWPLELDLAIDQGIDRVVSSNTNVWSWVELRAALSNDDRSWLHDFSAVLLNTKSLGITVATVSS